MNVAAPQRAVVPQAAAKPSRAEGSPKTQAPVRAPSRRAGSTDGSPKKGQPSDNPFGI